MNSPKRLHSHKEHLWCHYQRKYCLKLAFLYTAHICEVKKQPTRDGAAYQPAPDNPSEIQQHSQDRGEREFIRLGDERWCVPVLEFKKNTLNLRRSSGKIDCLSSLDMSEQWIVKAVQSGFSHLLQWGLFVVSDSQGRKKGPLKDACVTWSCVCRLCVDSCGPAPSCSRQIGLGFRVSIFLFSFL